MRYAIELRNLRKDFGGKTAVKGSSFNVEEGSLFSLLGVNGAGKTTTVRMLSGLSKATSGDAFVCGYSIKNQIDEVKKISNISTQETAVAQNLTVYENLMFIAQIYDMDNKKAKIKADEMIEKFSLDEMKHTKAKVLSGGWQRRLSIAMALISQPKVLFLDEPTLGLDVLARKELWKMIESLKGKITIILTTHYMDEAERLSDNAAVMIAGEVKVCGNISEIKRLTKKERLEDAFIAIAENEI